ncbi:MATE family efflux transporter [Uliginosibacterium sp. 31-12]|uniref:MATE family efflux transporter n=1 Tax=Uliginosibacterium sp. 31-12 TaxID=3062781 RepID=UPI0026E23787|nr:MATE family efflux transporter [Uliginosibacterium sp. 31-12]MDO6386769.1 MATE family efflux transporter [Uliginosibacterium sp. 31-12]
MSRLIRPEVWKLAAPVLVEQLFVNLLGSLGAIMAARLGSEPVSSIGNVEAFTLVVSSLFSALAIGATVVVAQCIGGGQRERAAGAAQQALASGLLMALLVAAAAGLWARELLALLYPGASSVMVEHMHQYLLCAAATYPLTALTLLACGVLRGAGDTRLVMQVNSLVTLLNVLLGYALIYGFELHTGWFTLGVPRLEVLGAGLAQWLARLGGVIFLIWAWRRSGPLFPQQGWLSFRFDTRLLRSLYSIGIPASVESLAFNGGKLLVQVVVMSFGPVAVAANYIAFSIAGIMNIPGNSLSVASTTLVGQAVGRGDEDAAAASMRYMLRLGWCVTAAIALVFSPLVPTVVSLYATEAAVQHQTSVLVWLNCAFLIAFPTTFILPNGLRGAGDARFAMITTIIGMLLFRILLGYVFGLLLGWGIVGVWLGMFTDWLLRSALYLWRLGSGRWRGRRLAA